MRPIDLVLQKLKLKDDGRRKVWRACCPAHGGKNPSALSITVGDNDAVLLRCWHGCTVEQVVSALGLDLRDLFPPKPEKPGDGGKPSKLKLPAAQALQVLNREALTIYIVGLDMRKEKSISETDFDRLAVAVRRVGQIVEATQ